MQISSDKQPVARGLKHADATSLYCCFIKFYHVSCVLTHQVLAANFAENRTETDEKIF